MERLTSLPSYIEELSTKFFFKEKDKIAVRAKLQRELKDMGLWQKAETAIIGRNKTKLFTNEQLEKLYQRTEGYLLKKSNIDGLDHQQIESIRKRNKKMLEHFNFDRIEEEKIGYQFATVTRVERIEFMLEAIFDRFFAPINIKQWEEDKQLYELTVDETHDFDDIDFILAKHRLKNRIKYYTKPKD